MTYSERGGRFVDNHDIDYSEVNSAQVQAGWGVRGDHSRRQESDIHCYKGLATNSTFLCQLFVRKFIDFPERANQSHLIGERLFSYLPPSNSLVSVSDPWTAFWADMTPFKGPRLALCIAPGTREIRTPSVLSRWARRSQETVKNGQQKPWLRVCKKHAF